MQILNEKIVGMLISAIGLDPVKFPQQVVALQNWVVNGVRNMDARVEAMEKDRAEMHAKLDTLINQLTEIQNGRYEPEFERSPDGADRPLECGDGSANGTDGADGSTIKRAVDSGCLN